MKFTVNIECSIDELVKLNISDVQKENVITALSVLFNVIKVQDDSAAPDHNIYLGHGDCASCFHSSQNSAQEPCCSCKWIPHGGLEDNWRSKHV